MREPLHPHWHSSDSTNADDVSHAVMAGVAGVTVSRRPAAVVGIGLVLVLGGFLFQAQDIFFPAQLTETDSQTTISSAPAQPVAASSSSSSATSVAEELFAAAPAEEVTPQEYVPVQNPLLPVNPNVYDQPLQAATPEGAYIPEAVGKGKPPEQPATGLPLWLLLFGSTAAMWLYARNSARGVFLYK